MELFGDWRQDAVDSLKVCNDELKRMHVLMRNYVADPGKWYAADITLSEVMDRIIKIQNTMLEVTRKLSGLEY